jgi:hypothetical protein
VMVAKAEVTDAAIAAAGTRRFRDMERLLGELGRERLLHLSVPCGAGDDVVQVWTATVPTTARRLPEVWKGRDPGSARIPPCVADPRFPWAVPCGPCVDRRHHPDFGSPCIGERPVPSGRSIRFDP